MFELTSESTDSDIHYDYEDCNICLNYKYFTEITVQLQVPIALHCVTSMPNLLNTLQGIRTQGKVSQREEQLKFSGNLLKPTVNKVI